MIKVQTIFQCAFRIIEHFKFGQFGKTAEAVWKSPNGTSIVSAKIQDNDVYYKDRLCFLQEAVTIIQFHHTNIIKLHGIVTDEEAVCDCTNYS